MRPHHRTTVLIFALVAVVLTVFFRTLESGFLRWDDDINVFENPRVHGLSAENLRWMFTDFEQAIRYKPLAWLAWALVHEVFGLNPFGYHLANLLLHCANTVLVFLLIRRLLQYGKQGAERRIEDLAMQDISAAIGALLWAVHPLRVEPVAWVTGLPYGLSLLFALVATLLYLRAHAPDADAGARRRDYWLSVAAFALAVLSYPIVLGFVAALVALDIYPLRRLDMTRPADFAGLRAVLSDKLPFVALSLLLVGGTLYGRFFVTGDWSKPTNLGEFPPEARVMQAFYLWAYYVWKSLLPLDLGPFYTTLLGNRPFAPAFTASALAVLGVSGLLFARRRVWPAAFALWLAHLGLLVPMLGLTERPHYPHDRYAIVNGVLIALATAACLWSARGRPWRRSALAAGALLVGLCVLGSLRQVRVWENDFVFFEELLRRVPATSHYRAVALLKVGNAHADAGDDAKAEARYREALALSSDTTFVQLPFNFGNTLSRQGKWAEAEAAYAQAVALAPRHLGARNNYGIALTQLGKLEAACAQFKEALRLRPDLPDTLLNYGSALLTKGDLPRAAEHLKRAVQLAPQTAEAHALLAEVLAKQGKPAEASKHAAEAERLRKVAEQR